MNSSQTIPKSIIIVGGGVFGLSTAEALSKRPSFSQTKITLVDSSHLPNPVGASVDITRICRPLYSNLTYAELALEAQKLWRNTKDGWGADGRYKESGFVAIANSGADAFVKSMTANILEVAQRVEGLGVIEELNTPEEVERVTKGTLYGDVGFVNWGSGYVAAERCVRYMLTRIDKDKVDFRTAEVSTLLYSENGNTVTGVRLNGGDGIFADLVVLAAGAWTTKLVDLKGRTEATGQAVTYYDLTEEEQTELEKRPIVMNFSTGLYVIPPLDRVLKIGRHGFGYRNPVKIPDPTPGSQEDVEVSLPATNNAVPAEGWKVTSDCLRDILPSLQGRKMKTSRVCWYTDT